MIAIFPKSQVYRSSSTRFIILIGLISLFCDLTYEGARGITGPFLAILGAKAVVVGFVAGLGELIGYAFRLVSGYVADRTRQYWLILSIGYSVNLLSIPLLALTHHWTWASILIVVERLGKAIRTPARDAMLANASDLVGMGWGFSLHKSLDQVGGMLGPLLIAGVLFWGGNYRESFALLTIPAIFALIVLYLAYRQYPQVNDLTLKSFKFERSNNPLLFLLLMASALVAIGYADFPLIAYHFQKQQVLNVALIPLAYGTAMGVDAIAVLLLGKLYDRYGVWVLVASISLTAFFAPLVFWGGNGAAFLGVVLWAIGIGVQDSLLRSLVGELAPADKRASIYGLFNTVFGIFWFLGSVTQGWLYDHSLNSVVYFILFFQIASLPLFFFLGRRFIMKAS